MKIIRKVWSHLSLDGEKKSSNGDIRESEPYEVGNFKALVRIIAKISYNNPEWSLFYRGQSSDYKNKGNLTSVYPSIYRSRKGFLVNKNQLRRNFNILKEAESELLSIFNAKKFDGYKKIEKFKN